MRIDYNREALSQLKYDERGLIPAIIQDEKGRVLMLAYMNRESLERTLAGGLTCFYSRSRRQLWLKGETSGHYQHVQSISYDCDADTLLIRVHQDGVACHRGTYSCFSYSLGSVPDGPAPAAVAGPDGGEVEEGPRGGDLASALTALAQVIAERRQSAPEGSYTARKEITREVADLFYHVLTLLEATGVSPDEVGRELARRRR